MHFRSFFCLLGLAILARAAAPELLLVSVGDQHSAYERYPQFIATIDRLRSENPGVPMGFLIAGDVFEAGNAVGQRSSGSVDFALLGALVQRGPTVLTLGNHETDLFSPADVVARLRAAGVMVISSNLHRGATKESLAPASTSLQLGAHELTIVGFTTDRLTTFRAAVRAELEIDEPVAWARRNIPRLLRPPSLPVVLSHAGLVADRSLLGAGVPDGTLFVGAHDHIQVVHRQGRTVYVQSGAWLEAVAVAALRREGNRLVWDVRLEPIEVTGPADAQMSALVQATLDRCLTAPERRIVARTEHARNPSEAARFAVGAARAVAQADAAVIGGTTFGAGLPAGDVSQYAFDACVRFDGTLYVGEVDGVQLRRILARANQGPATPFADRTGENLVAVGPTEIDPARRYRIVTTDWIARNPARYLGENPPALSEQPALRLKAAVLAALHTRQPR